MVDKQPNKLYGGSIMKLMKIETGLLVAAIIGTGSALTAFAASDDARMAAGNWVSNVQHAKAKMPAKTSDTVPDETKANSDSDNVSAEIKTYATGEMPDNMPEDALELMELNEYDLVILDLNIPGIDGIEVLKTLRHTKKELKVLILSARNEVEDKVSGLDAGANDYLSKPFDFNELAARIRNLLRWSFTQTESVIV
ncbi:two-component response regulator YkoH-like protein [Paenibacillus larvae subsp. larvae B-3650]|nr:two-component response regulator YkoH-like protein [Paenibacillus larvae subsp. larvae B-3650]